MIQVAPFTYTFPEDTTYFYGYPAGEADGFYNQVPPWVEELVAARPLVCTLPDFPFDSSMRVVSFASTIKTEVLSYLKDLGITLFPEDQIIALPEDITADITGDTRNTMIKKALLERVQPGSLIMAQPFLGDDIEQLYRFDAQKTVRLNDKLNLSDIVPSRYLPRRYNTVSNGTELSILSPGGYVPCVIKVGSSSAGDGVQVCKTPEQFKTAQQKLKNVNLPILIEEYLDIEKNQCIQFLISDSPLEPIFYLGVNEQLTSPSGEFMGGIVPIKPKVSPEIMDLLTKRILPQIRQKGWYGICALDVVTKRYTGEIFIIDPNFRMNSSTPFVLQARNRVITKDQALFMGRIKGKKAEIRENLRRLSEMGTQEQKLNIVALSEKEDGYDINAAILFDQPETLSENASEIQEKTGIQADALTTFATS